MSAANYLAGINASEQLLRSQPQRVKRVILDERSVNARLDALAALASESNIPVERRRSHRLDDLTGGTPHQGVVLELAGSWVWDEAALQRMVEARLVGNEPLLLLALDEVTDPRNLGACLRSAAAAGVDAVILPRSRSAELTPAARKVASGGAEIVPLVRVPSLPRTCERIALYGVRVVGAQGAAPGAVYDCDLTGPTLLVLGAERTGLSPEVACICSDHVSIPMTDAVDSLNVSVAAALLVFEARRQRRTLA